MTGVDWPGRPFHVSVGRDVLDDLDERLRRTRFPREQAGPDWATGTPLDFARRLRDHWLEDFDWRHWEHRINALCQRMVSIDGFDIHVVLERGSGEAPLPLLLTNGWPASFLEYIDIIEQLAHPERFGGRVEDAFTVVIPSMPGFGFSPPPAQPVTPEKIAALWAALMPALGLHDYVAFGSDWGSLVTGRLALHHREGIRAIQLTSASMFPTMDENAPPLTAGESAWQKAAHARMHTESGYQLIQGTKPQSLAYGHTDSPMALACWIAEKFHGWTVPGEERDPPVAMDLLLANIMLYWLNGALAPMWLYTFLGQLKPVPAGQKVMPRAGFLFSPHDLIVPPPRSWLERIFDVGRVTHSATIGHFPALDDPALVIDEIRSFMREFR